MGYRGCVQGVPRQWRIAFGDGVCPWIELHYYKGFYLIILSQFFVPTDYDTMKVDQLEYSIEATQIRGIYITV